MKLTNRLMACAQMVPPDSLAADIGTDHGYLPIYLLKQGICPYVIAADLREMPLAAAKRNAKRAGVYERIRFILSDGLEAVPIESVDTVICAGMGGDCIQGILERKKEVWTPQYGFILQPQSSADVLRKWLGQNGFLICEERLAQDGKFVYTVMDVRYGDGKPTEPGQHFIPDHLLSRRDPLMQSYFDRVYGNLKRTVGGLVSAKKDVDPEMLGYYQSALADVEKRGRNYGLCE